MREGSFADVICVQTYVTPGATAVANIGWRYFVLFACLTVVSILVIYFFYPETSKKSLEELAAHFGETVITDENAGLGKAGTDGGHHDMHEKGRDGTGAEYREGVVG